MRLGIISDTHDRLDHLRAALEFFARKRAGLVVHCGDWKSPAIAAYCAEQAAMLRLPVRGVLGNNDTAVDAFMDFARQTAADFQLVEGVLELNLEGKKLAAYHGHHLPTRRRLLADTAYDAVLLGHSHKPLIEQSGHGLLINPGSTAFAIPRSKNWRPSVALLDLPAMTASIHYL